MGQVHVTNPRYVIVVSGGCCSPKTKKFVVGGWAYVWSCVTNVQKISLELMTLLPKCENVETSEGVPLTVTATAQCKIIKDKELLQIACEQFLGYDIDEIQFAICSTLEGHLRSILGEYILPGTVSQKLKTIKNFIVLGTLTVEEVYKDREKFALLVREVAAPDVEKMGIEIISFTIKDISDKVGYLLSLGKAQTAIVKRDANIGVAVANRDAGIKEAEAEKAAMDFKYMTDAKIGKNTNAYKISLSEFEREIQTKKAEVSLAYEIQSNILTQAIKEAQVKVEIMERKKMIEVEEHEVSRKDLELTASVRLPAEAEAFQMEKISEGKKNKSIAEATGEAEKTKLVGSAEAFRVSAVGGAEASRMLSRAKIFRNYSSAAKLAIILDNLPDLASHISSPLSKIDEMLLLGQTDDVLDNLNKLFGKIPPSLRTIAGIDVTNVLKARLASSRVGTIGPDYEGKLTSLPK